MARKDGGAKKDGGTKKPGRIAQVRQTYQMAKRVDPRIGWITLGTIVAVARDERQEKKRPSHPPFVLRRPGACTRRKRIVCDAAETG